VIYYRNDVRKSGVDGRALRATAKRLLAAAGEAGSSLSLTLVGDDAMRELNRDHRGKDTPTDVLSFPLLVIPSVAKRSRGTPRRNRKVMQPDSSTPLGMTRVSLPSGCQI
jgi:ssRNA-specific RNase YbeY (16S rRNA maturation enzyme)